VWLALFAVYAATLGIDAFDSARFGGDEPHYLLTARSIAQDGDVDLANQYAERQYAGFYPYRLDPHGHPTNGRLDEPHGAGLALLIAPAYAAFGATGVQLELAAIAALGFVLAIALARRMVPEPWATTGPLVCALSPPALAYSTAILPPLVAGTVLAGAALLGLQARERPRLLPALGCGFLLALLPWLGTQYLVPAVPIGFALAWWLGRQHKGWFALVALEVVLASLVAFATTSTGPIGWWRCGSTATTACCAGRRSSRSPSWPSGCCGARGSTASRASSRTSATSRRPRSRWCSCAPRR
jgi:hypothetical protein